MTPPNKITGANPASRDRSVLALASIAYAHKQSGSKLPHSKRFASTNAHCIRGSA